MARFKKESLEALKERVDLIDLLSAHIELKRAGGSYKALCPFHDEKSPSFVVQRGDSHYHCFGCGAHGDAIAFLMDHLRMSFVEAVEYLGERYGVALDRVEKEEGGPNRGEMKRCLAEAHRFFQAVLLQTEEGHGALAYLYDRGLGLPFIKKFGLGLAPAQGGLLRRFLEEEKVPLGMMQETGLIKGTRDFFYKRILFPITDGSGVVIGFSGRRYTEDVGGGKYVNTPETALFKKSRVLFGLSYSRKRMAKEHKAIVVEGQIDALRLIDAGFDYTVAGQGTAFGEQQADEVVRLGVKEVVLALDPDKAGRAAAAKVGDLFQKRGAGVKVAMLPEGKDPDSLLKEGGKGAFEGVLRTAQDYLSFLVAYKGEEHDLGSPAGKAQLVREIAEQIKGWEDKVMVHESLRRLAHLTRVPEEVVGVAEVRLASYSRPSGSVRGITLNPDQILEGDLLSWLLQLGSEKPELLEAARGHLGEEHFRYPPAREIFLALLRVKGDRLSLLSELSEEAQNELVALMSKRIPHERVATLFPRALQKILERSWLERREEIRQKIQAGGSEEEVLAWVRAFDALGRARPC
ncbi:MAG: DNA primase [Parachlamydiales bacterium]